jgi:pyruvate kinase
LYDLPNLEEVFKLGKEVALETAIVTRGDLVVIIAGLPLTQLGSTNLVKIESV